MDVLSSLPAGERHYAEVSARRLFERQLERTPFLFASPQQTLSAWSSGTVARLDSGGGGAVRAALDAALEQGVAAPYVVGASPFLDEDPAHLWVTSDCLRQPGRILPQQRKRPSGRLLAVEGGEGAAGYRQAVSEALACIGRGEMSKVVLSRAIEVRWSAPLELDRLLVPLLRINPQGYTFAVDLSADGGGRRTLIGASPELLVSRRGFAVRANPLAGSTPRSRDPDLDRQRAELLRLSPKDLREHTVVVESVAESLRPFCRVLNVPRTPSLVGTPRLWHLSTEVTGELLDPEITSHDLARALHPTPAVCGHPAAAARELIGRLEPVGRGLFTGMVGWCDAAGDGEWAVTIRCAEVAGDRLRLYAGAGVVEGSDPQRELEETATKLQTLLDVLGIPSEVPA